MAGPLTGFNDGFEKHYPLIRRLLSRRLRLDRPSATLDTVALASEVYLRLRKRRLLPDTPGRLLGAAAEECRRFLVDRARRKGAQKRGARPVEERPDTWSGIPEPTRMSQDELLWLDKAFARLGARSPHDEVVARAIWLYYTGLPQEEIASALGLDARTVRRHLAYGFAWLQAEL